MNFIKLNLEPIEIRYTDHDTPAFQWNCDIWDFEDFMKVDTGYPEHIHGSYAYNIGPRGLFIEITSDCEHVNLYELA